MTQPMDPQRYEPYGGAGAMTCPKCGGHRYRRGGLSGLFFSS